MELSWKKKDEIIRKLQEDKKELQGRNKEHKRRVKELLGMLEKSDPELYDLDKRKIMIRKEIDEFRSLREEHEKKWEEFQLSNDRFSKENREKERMKTDDD